MVFFAASRPIFYDEAIFSASMLHLQSVVFVAAIDIRYLSSSALEISAMSVSRFSLKLLLVLILKIALLGIAVSCKAEKFSSFSWKASECGSHWLSSESTIHSQVSTSKLVGVLV